jgi:hypothetical protein
MINMSLWAGIAIGISCALIVLEAVSLYRGYHVIKVLKELYYFQVFTLDRYPVNELVVGNSIKYAIKRYVPSVALCTYREVQFELPPWMQLYLIAAYACILWTWNQAMVVMYSTSETDIYIAVACSLISTFILVAVTILLTRLFFSIFAPETPKFYNLDDGTPTNLKKTVPMLELDIYDNGEKDLTVSRFGGDYEDKIRRREDDSDKQDRIKFEICLLILLLIAAIAQLWSVISVYKMTEQELEACFLQWLIGLALDFPFRIILSIMLSRCPFDTKYKVTRKAVIPRKELKMYKKSPTCARDPLLELHHTVSDGGATSRLTPPSTPKGHDKCPAPPIMSPTELSFSGKKFIERPISPVKEEAEPEFEFKKPMLGLNVTSNFELIPLEPEDVEEEPLRQNQIANQSTLTIYFNKNELDRSRFGIAGGSALNIDSNLNRSKFGIGGGSALNIDSKWKAKLYKETGVDPDDISILFDKGIQAGYDYNDVDMFEIPKELYGMDVYTGSLNRIQPLEVIDFDEVFKKTPDGYLAPLLDGEKQAIYEAAKRMVRSPTRRKIKEIPKEIFARDKKTGLFYPIRPDQIFFQNDAYKKGENNKLMPLSEVEKQAIYEHAIEEQDKMMKAVPDYLYAIDEYDNLRPIEPEDSEGFQKIYKKEQNGDIVPVNAKQKALIDQAGSSPGMHEYLEKRRKDRKIRDSNIPELYVKDRKTGQYIPVEPEDVNYYRNLYKKNEAGNIVPLSEKQRGEIEEQFVMKPPVKNREFSEIPVEMYMRDPVDETFRPIDPDQVMAFDNVYGKMDDGVIVPLSNQEKRDIHDRIMKKQPYFTAASAFGDLGATGGKRSLNDLRPLYVKDPKTDMYKEHDPNVPTDEVFYCYNPHGKTFIPIHKPTALPYISKNPATGVYHERTDELGKYEDGFVMNYDGNIVKVKHDEPLEGVYIKLEDYLQKVPKNIYTKQEPFIKLNDKPAKSKLPWSDKSADNSSTSLPVDVFKVKLDAEAFIYREGELQTKNIENPSQVYLRDEATRQVQTENSKECKLFYFNPLSKNYHRVSAVHDNSLQPESEFGNPWMNNPDYLFEEEKAVGEGAMPIASSLYRQGILSFDQSEISPDDKHHGVDESFLNEYRKSIGIEGEYSDAIEEVDEDAPLDELDQGMVSITPPSSNVPSSGEEDHRAHSLDGERGYESEEVDVVVMPQRGSPRKLKFQKGSYVREVTEDTQPEKFGSKPSVKVARLRDTSPGMFQKVKKPAKKEGKIVKKPADVDAVGPKNDGFIPRRLQPSNKIRNSTQPSKIRRRNDSSSSSEGMKTPRNKARKGRLNEIGEVIYSEAESEISEIAPTDPYCEKKPHKRISSMEGWRRLYRNHRMPTSLKPESEKFVRQRGRNKWPNAEEESTIKIISGVLARKKGMNSPVSAESQPFKFGVPGKALRRNEIETDTRVRVSSPQGADQGEIMFEKVLPLTKEALDELDTLHLAGDARPNDDARVVFDKAMSKNNSQDRFKTMQELLSLARESGHEQPQDVEKLSQMLKRREKQKKKTKSPDNLLHAYDHPYKELLWMMMKEENKAEALRNKSMRKDRSISPNKPPIGSLTRNQTVGIIHAADNLFTRLNAQNQNMSRIRSESVLHKIEGEPEGEILEE